MIRKIVEINERKCTGCGLCAEACHEGAIIMESGKAKLIRDDYCDGLGDCLPACPADAISIIERDALPYDEAAVQANITSKKKSVTSDRSSRCECDDPAMVRSCLSQWPVQIQLAPVDAAYFEDADMLIAADCTAYAYGDFHNRFIRDRVTLVGCPKLDPVDYSEKLSAIFRHNSIRSITLARMEVPCCGGLEYAVRMALEESGKSIPLQTSVISIDGDITSTSCPPLL